MATKKKTDAEVEAEEMLEEPAAEQTEPAEAAAADPKDALIAQLRAELAAANKKAVYATPMDERKRVQEMARQAAEAGMNEWDIKVAVRVPKRPASEDPWYWININSVSAQFPANDQVQELKLPWAVALMDMLTAEERAQDYADSIQVYDPVSNPH